MNNTQEKKVWDFLCSVKLTIFLLILLAGTSIIGTIIPQEEAGGQLTKSLGPAFEKIVISLRLFDMYHSSWFQLIIFVLALNLIACSLDKIPGTLKLFKKIPSADREKIFDDTPSSRRIESSRKAPETLSHAKALIQKQYSRTIEKRVDTSVYLYGDKGRYSLFGVYLVHFSVLLILTGAIIGSLFGFKGFINIIEGESVDRIFIGGSDNHSHIDLGFTVKCDKFSVDFYEDGTPKEYKSDISFLADGETISQGHLLVNHPLTFRGISFYQSSYGSIAGDEAQINVKYKDSREPLTLNIAADNPVTLPDNNGTITLVDSREDFMGMGPAILVNIKPAEGDEVQIWLFKHHRMIEQQFPSFFEKYQKFNPSIIEPYIFSLDNLEMVNYTGLQVNKDPGIFFIYSGFFAIITGLFVTFFSSHRRVWVKIQEQENGTKIFVAGIARKNPIGMERELDRLADQFRTKLNRK